MAFCIQCGHRNPDEGRFCDQCGNPLVWDANETSQPKPSHPSAQACPVCGKSSSSDRFCTNCGHKFTTISAPVTEPVAAEQVAPPAVEESLTTAMQADGPQESRLKAGEKPTSRRDNNVGIGIGIAVGLAALGVAAYVMMNPSPSEAPSLAAPNVESSYVAPPAESRRVPGPSSALPLASEPSSSPVVVETPAESVLPAAVPPAPRSAPVRRKPAPPVDKAPSPPPPAAPPMEQKPVQEEARKQFSCSDLPFGLLVACGLEGKDVIRKCAPDLKDWNHDIPGCNRRGGTSNN